MSNELSITDDAVEEAPLAADSKDINDSNTLKQNLTEVLRESESLSKFNSVEDLANSYLNLERSMSSKVKIPGENSSSDELNSFYSKISNIPGVVIKPVDGDEEQLKLYNKTLGVPEKPTDYNLPENIELDNDTKLNLFNLSHKLGLTNEKMVELAKFKTEQDSTLNKASEDFKKENDKILREKWGPDYDARYAGAQAAFNRLKEQYGEEAMLHLKQSGATSNAAFISILSDIGEGLKDANNLKGDNISYGMTTEEIVSEMASLRSHPGYYNMSHPEHKAVNNKLLKLQRKIDGTNK